MEKPRIVVLGAGFGGLYAARGLERRARDAEITVVSDVNFMLYTPLLPGAAGGTLEPRHVIVGAREHLKRSQLRLARVYGADPHRQVVAAVTPEGKALELHYDQLVVSLGSTSRTAPVTGLAEHALGFKTLSEAIALRNRLIHTLELAEETEDPGARRALLTYVFVGAGYAGLEGIAELQDFAVAQCRRYPVAREHGLRFVLVEARERVMPEIDASLAEFAAARLRRRGLEIRTHTTLESVTTGSVTLTGGEVIPARTVCWTAGVRPVDAVAQLGLPLGVQGRIQVDEHMRVAGFRNVWAIGDAAAVPDPARPGQPCPPTCQHALRQGRLVARNIAAALEGREPRPFTYKTLGVFVDMGRFQAVASTMGVRWRGFPAWFLARTYHLAMMPGLKRRLRLMADWTVGLLFGRDATDLGQLGHPPRLELPEGGREGGPLAGVGLDDRAGA